MQNKYKLTQDILRDEVLLAYDIRGIVGENLTKKDAYFLGRGYGSFLVKDGRKSCIIGYDGRHTSIEYCTERNNENYENKIFEFLFIFLVNKINLLLSGLSNQPLGDSLR